MRRDFVAVHWRDRQIGWQRVATEGHVSEAVLAQLYAIRAAVDAAIILAQSQQAPPAAPSEPAVRCPKCGASGEETQHLIRTLDGAQRWKCTGCGEERPA